jgi:glutamyl-tRNA synthetase
LTPTTRAQLGRVAQALDQEPWDTASLEARVRALAEKEGAKLGDLAQPLRVAVTGRTASPPIFEVLAVLGREEALTRIRAHAD